MWCGELYVHVYRVIHLRLTPCRKPQRCRLRRHRLRMLGNIYAFATEPIITTAVSPYMVVIVYDLSRKTRTRRMHNQSESP